MRETGQRVRRCQRSLVAPLGGRDGDGERICFPVHSQMSLSVSCYHDGQLMGLSNLPALCSPPTPLDSGNEIQTQADRWFCCLRPLLFFGKWLLEPSDTQGSIIFFTACCHWLSIFVFSINNKFMGLRHFLVDCNFFGGSLQLPATVQKHTWGKSNPETNYNEKL